MFLKIIGFMCIPPAEDNPTLHFGSLKNLANKLKLDFLSMGMSSDYDIAIQLGATHIRIGSAFFGDRLIYSIMCLVFVFLILRYSLL